MQTAIFRIITQVIILYYQQLFYGSRKTNKKTRQYNVVKKKFCFCVTNQNKKMNTQNTIHTKQKRQNPIPKKNAPKKGASRSVKNFVVSFYNSYGKMMTKLSHE